MDTSEPPSEEPQRPSRRQAKRDATDMLGLAQRLVRVPARRLGELDLDPELVAEVEKCRNLRRTAERRQLKRIAQVLRKMEWREIAALDI